MPGTIESRVRGILLTDFGVDEPKGESRLVADLGFDSLDVIEFIMALEDEFKITIQDDLALDVETVQQAVAIMGKLTGNGAK